MDMQDDDNFDPNATAYLQALQNLSKGNQQATSPFGVPTQQADQQGVQSASPDEHPNNAPAAPFLQGQQFQQQSAMPKQQQQAASPAAKDSSAGNPYFYAAPEDDQKKQGSNQLGNIMQFAPLLARLA